MASNREKDNRNFMESDDIAVAPESGMGDGLNFDVQSVQRDERKPAESVKGKKSKTVSGLDDMGGDVCADERIEELNAKVKKLMKELEAQRDLYIRLAAEYDNYRKRTERGRLLIYSDATAAAIVNILPIADSLDAAIKSFGDAPEEYRKGMDLLAGQLKASFEKLGVSSFGMVGEVFDPNECEAIQHIDDDSLGENVIVEVLRKGYKIKDKVIRCAMVRVAN